MSVITMGVKGLDAFIVSVETDISRGLYHFDIVGLGDKAVAESKSRILSAIKNSGFKSPKTAQQKITVLLSPAGIKKEGSHFDLPVALSYLEKCGYISGNTDDIVIVGELSLQGKIQPVKNILLMALTAKNLGYKKILLPEQNTKEAKLIDSLLILEAETLAQAVDMLNGRIPPATSGPARRGAGLKTKSAEKSAQGKSFNIDRVRGQEHAKRALEIALAGKHHLALYGPPGIGKSLIAKSVTELLPPLSREEAVECRIIHDSAGALSPDLDSIFDAPFRDPHHTSSYSAILGTAHRPGEISLAHNGILFMDEFAEFDRRALEALRQPMEDGDIKNHRAGGFQVLPANCIIIVAMNLCRCGNYGSLRKKCVCTAQDLLRYAKKMSGPLADRMDMWVPLRELSGRGAAEEKFDGETGLAMKKRIQKVRDLQKKRAAAFVGAHAGALRHKKREARLRLVQNVRDILSETARAAAERAAEKLGLSARSADSVLLVARTIADIEYARDPANNLRNELLEEHILEALNYRKKF